jgi:hypothetical protein
MILVAARLLERTDLRGKAVEWFWNPRQTGDATEPDLRGVLYGKIAISAEVTCSERPAGVIDTRMATTLGKLDAMPGRKFYFVRTEEMAQRGRTKVRKRRYDIEVRLTAG